MKWFERLFIFVLLLILAGVIINFGGKLLVPFSQVIGGIIIGFAISFIIFTAMLEGGHYDN